MRYLPLAVFLFAPFVIAEDKKDDAPLVYPQIGSDVPGPFTSYMVTGTRKTKFHCLVTEYALNPTVMVVMHGAELTPTRKYFLEKLDRAIHLNPNKRLGGFVVFLSDKLTDAARWDDIREEFEKQILDVEKDAGLKHLQLAMTPKKQLEKYKIDEQADVFVLFYDRYRILSVYNLTKEQFTQDKVKEILSGVVDQLGGRKPD